MKIKILTVLAALFIANVNYGQKQIAWFDVGLKAMYGGSSILNSTAMDHSDVDYMFAFGNAYSFGGKFGINSGYNGLAIEAMYNKADHELQILNDSYYAPKMEWESYDLYLLFRNAQNLGFFEIGPKFSFIQKFSRANENGELVDIADDINSPGISGVLSFGVNVIGTDGAFSGQIGIRAEYGFVDLIGDSGQANGEPYATIPNFYGGEYTKNTPIFVGLVFELNWGLGWYGVSQCGGRPKLFAM